MPTDGLVGIAVEGLSSADNQTAASESVEIADLTLYYGRFHTFDDAERVVVLQFKYSIRAKRVPFRMSDARETVRKFAAAYGDHKSRHGAGGVSQKLGFNLEAVAQPGFGPIESITWMGYAIRSNNKPPGSPFFRRRNSRYRRREIGERRSKETGEPVQANVRL
jgi:hypothetical protein